MAEKADPHPNQPFGVEKVRYKYDIIADDVPAVVEVVDIPKEFLPLYRIKYPLIGPGTSAILDSVREKLIASIALTNVEILDPKVLDSLQAKFKYEAYTHLSALLPDLSEGDIKILGGHLVHEMIGLGDLEMLLSDPYLEEIVVNCAREPANVYHKKFGWLATNIHITEEKKIYEFSQFIGRRVGRQISTLTPLLDAHLISGDRVNSTLFPISTKGNTITIRKFARDPWTVVDFIDPKVNTLSKRVAAFLWLCLQYEMNMLIAGGTGSGKTSLLNALTPFFPPSQRILSIEDTRELQLPNFLHWVPLTTRLANPEGKGAVEMIDLMINSLRMRPDRILVGEVRKSREAEVLFEAMHTGHAVYATFHADTATQVYRRFVNPPIDIAPSMFEALHLVCVQFRHRRLGIRRTFEIAEVLPASESSRDEGVKMNVLYKWKPLTDTVEPDHESSRLAYELERHTGMGPQEMEKDLEEKEKVLDWLLSNRINRIDPVGKVVSEYYRNKDIVMDAVLKKKKPEALLDEEMLKQVTKVLA